MYYSVKQPFRWTAENLFSLHFDNPEVSTISAIPETHQPAQKFVPSRVKCFRTRTKKVGCKRFKQKSRDDCTVERPFPGLGEQTFREYKCEDAVIKRGSELIRTVSRRDQVLIAGASEKNGRGTAGESNVSERGTKFFRGSKLNSEFLQ